MKKLKFDSMNLLQKKFLFISISVLLYIASLFIPAYTHLMLDNEDTLEGWRCLAQGFFAFDYIKEYTNPFPFIAWLSNLPFFIGLCILLIAGKHRVFKVASIFLFTSLFGSFGALVCYGAMSHFYPEPGCIVWIFSQLMLFTGAYILMRETATTEEDRGNTG